MKLLLKLKFFIRVKIFKLPFLTKRERLKVYEFLLERVNDYIQGKSTYVRFSCFCYSLGSPDNPMYKKYKNFIKQSSIKENYPELYEQKPDYLRIQTNRNAFINDTFEYDYWFTLTQDGMYKRQNLLIKATNKVK